MRRSTILLLALLSLAGGLALGPNDAGSCNQFNAYLPSGSVCVGTYIRIDSGSSSTDTSCPQETFSTLYSVTFGSTCGGTDGGCSPTQTGYVYGNNLSGNYRVDVVDGRCLKLCDCQ